MATTFMPVPTARIIRSPRSLPVGRSRVAKRNSRIPTSADIPFPGMPTPQPRGSVRGVGSARRAAPSARTRGAIDFASGTTAKAEANRSIDPSLEVAIEAAKAGDDSMLLPYQPTPSINPPRPRTLAAGYDADTQTLRVRFRDGAGYEYYNVPPRVWRNFKRVKSPGRAINRTLNQYPYAEADW